MLPGLGLITAMTLFLWRLTLFAQRTLVHGDSIIFGLPLFMVRDRVLSGAASPFWADGIFGGHPLFAEGQGGFLNPILMVLAAVVTPGAGAIFTADLFRVLCMILTGAGILGLSASLGLSRWAGAFAAIAVIFSPLWLYLQTNPGLGGPYLYLPWCLWAFEAWLKHCSIRRGALMGAGLAGMILAGYPQAFHGTLLYMAASLVTVPFAPAQRAEWTRNWRARLGSAAIGAFLCAGIAAVQILPLMELVGLSHRSGGVPLQFQLPPSYYLRGILYTLIGDVPSARAFPANGSLMVCILALLYPIFGRSPRLAGHGVAALVLMQLGMGDASSVFRFVYAHNLIPGLNYFRGVGLYLAQWVLGASVIAGGAVDWIARRCAQGRSAWTPPLLGGLGLAAILSLWGLERLHTPGAPLLEFAVAALTAIGIFAAARQGRGTWLSLFVTLLMAVECAGLRLQTFRAGSVAVLAEPASIQAIEALPDWRDFKVIDTSSAAAYAFLDSRVVLDSSVRKMLSAMSGLTPLIWNLRGMDGALALPLARLMEARPLLYDEIAGKTSAPPGTRLIDQLAVRFVAEDAPSDAAGFHVFWHAADSVYVAENLAAKPRFQVYANHISVSTFAEALARFRAGEQALIIEAPASAALPVESAETTESAEAPFAFKVEQDEPTSHRFATSGSRGGWLFIADANYPGWTAEIDNRPTPVFTAQILGKAVFVPPGEHQVALAFRSNSVLIGGSISGGAAILTALALIFGGKMSVWRRSAGRNEA